MTPQRRYQKRMLADGRCIICGAPLGKYKERCDKHAVAHRASVRKARGLQPWQAGSRGPKPKVRG